MRGDIGTVWGVLGRVSDGGCFLCRICPTFGWERRQTVAIVWIQSRDDSYAIFERGRRSKASEPALLRRLIIVSARATSDERAAASFGRDSLLLIGKLPILHVKRLNCLHDFGQINNSVTFTLIDVFFSLRSVIYECVVSFCPLHILDDSVSSLFFCRFLVRMFILIG